MKNRATRRTLQYKEHIVGAYRKLPWDAVRELVCAEVAQNPNSAFHKTALNCRIKGATVEELLREDYLLRNTKIYVPR